MSNETDTDRLVFERRAFLQGFLVTSAGLLVQRTTISIPAAAMNYETLIHVGRYRPTSFAPDSRQPAWSPTLAEAMRRLAPGGTVLVVAGHSETLRESLTHVPGARIIGAHLEHPQAGYKNTWVR